MRKALFIILMWSIVFMQGCASKSNVNVSDELTPLEKAALEMQEMLKEAENGEIQDYND